MTENENPSPVYPEVSTDTERAELPAVAPPRSKILNPDEFEDGVRRVHELGLEFSADLAPNLILPSEKSAELIDGEELRNLQSLYPTLPREVGFVAHNTITGQSFGIIDLGGPDFFEKKKKTVERYVLNSRYNEEFFFKHALKVPYFKNLDWEVVMKIREKGVQKSLNSPYCLLRITFAEPDDRSGFGLDEKLTLAIGRYEIAKLIDTLTDLKDALEKCDLADKPRR